MKTRLQELRKAAGFKSAKAFAEHIGMNVNTYTNYEQNRCGLNVELLCMLADELNCTTDELIGRTVPKPDMDDPIQYRINEAYKSMNAHGRKRLYEEAEIMASSGMFDDPTYTLMSKNHMKG